MDLILLNIGLLYITVFPSLIFIVIVIVILFVILNLLPVAFMYSYFDGKLNTEDCPVMNMQIHQNQNHSKIFSFSEHL